ncbi:MAG TPA: type 2 isopentenyl-diphosphate Delta-isomerase [Anaerolineaceae bacterium]|nr:type 2 isopentenyl-diphosphate Delta-isomerase [Anaerolineaceae bacterium]
MESDIPIPRRKNEHLRIALEEDVSSGLTAGFDAITLRHKALPEMDFESVDISTTFLGHELDAPILISSMTGGSSETARLNQILAIAAEHCNVAIAIGSVRSGLENQAYVETYNIRKLAPNALIFSNLGAVQLNYGFDVDSCKKAIEIAGADAIFLHLNALQEVLQPDGDHNWSGVLRKIEEITHALKEPVLVKEVGWGIDRQTYKALVNVGVAAVDVAGAGGTSWSQVEMFRQPDLILRRIASDFRSWGLTTVDCLEEIFVDDEPKIPVIASGGLRNGIDLAKSLALGASLGGFARALLPAANVSAEVLRDELEVIKYELKIALFACGIPNTRACNRSMIFRRFQV